MTSSIFYNVTLFIWPRGQKPPRPPFNTIANMAAFNKLSCLFERFSPLINGVKRYNSTLSNFRQILGAEVTAIREAGTFKHERVITTPQAAEIKVQEREGPLLNFCANNYLGLSVNI